LDLRTRTQVKISGPLVGKVTGAYAFLGSDRVAGVDTNNRKDSGIFSFPDGKQLKKVDIPFGHMQAVSSTDGSSWVLADGFKDYRLSLADMDKGFVKLGAETDAVDLWNGMLANENKDGTITLRKFDGEKMTMLGSVAPLQSQLAPLRAVAVSRDGRYLAASTKSRGCLWDLSTGKQVLLLRGFRLGWNGDDDLLMEFPKSGKVEASLVDVSLSKRTANQAGYPLKEMHLQEGMLSEWKDLGKQGKELIVHRTSDGSELWTRSFSEGTPEYTESFGWKDLLFSFPLSSSHAKSQLKSNPKLMNEAAAVKSKDDAQLIEVVDTATGKTVDSVVVELSQGYIGSVGLNRVGDQLYVSMKDHRTRVYSLTNGHQLRQMFGSVVAADVGTGRVCMTDRQDEAVVYDAGGKELARLRMGTPLRFSGFVDGGAKLVLLGADQIVRMVPVSAGPAMSVASTK
jgi:WD40 repeat protein